MDKTIRYVRGAQCYCTIVPDLQPLNWRIRQT
jgi:hypothetical protein